MVRLLAAPRLVVAAAAVFFCLSLVTVRGGFVMDDHVQLDMVVRGTRAPWDLFRFHSGDPAETLREIRAGALPWILSPDVKVAFFRPLVSIGHWLDYRFLAGAPALLHLHSLLWFGALLASVGWVCRSIEGPGWTAALLFVVFAASSSCAACVGWLAGRNAVMAAAFGMAALGMHHRHRGGAAGAFRAGALVAFAACLACGETSACVLAFFLAHAVFVDRAALRDRAAHLSPYLLLALAFWGAARALGYGTFATGMYVDPVASPALFASLLPAHLSALLLDELGWGYVRLFLPQGMVPAVFAGVHLMLVAIVLFVAATRDRLLRFWLSAGLLAMIPVSLAEPHPRLLLLPHLGLSGALVRALRVAAFATSASTTPRRPWAVIAAAVIGTSLAVTALLGLASYPILARKNATIARIEDRNARTLEVRADQDAIVMNAQWVVPLVVRLKRRELGLPPPRSILTLTNSAAAEVERVDSRTLVVRSHYGILGATGLGLRPSPFAKDESISGPRCSIDVLDPETSPTPTTVRFTFDAPLEEPSLAWFILGPRGYVRIEPPLEGSRTIFVAP